MHFERASIYGIMALAYLAQQPDRLPANAAQIAQATRIPIEYLRKLLGRLSRARLIQPIRGRRGGFHLARATDQITTLHIIQAIEGHITGETLVNDAALEGKRDPVSRHLRQWRSDTADQMRQILQSTTLQDLVANTKNP